MSSTVIRTNRLELVLLGHAALTAMAGGGSRVDDYWWPQWWPDDTDSRHVERWLTKQPNPAVPPQPWGARAIVQAGEMIGHIGFHGPPATIEQALEDPTYVGPKDPAPCGPGGTIEVGYTVFPEHRSNGFATEAFAGLIAWAIETGEISTVLASIAPDNLASLQVLDQVGAFTQIGTCTDAGSPELVFRRNL